MKVVIAIDSFKGSLTSLQAGNAAEEGIKKVYPDAEIFVRPVADGGEGTVDTLVSGLQGEKHTVNVTGPLGETVLAEYGIIDNHTAVIEMSAAAGITLVSPEKRNPLYTTTYGVGEIIIDAIKKNCRNFIIGIGDNAARAQIAERMQGVDWYTAVHPSAIVSKFGVSIGEGSAVMANAVVNPLAKIGAHCIVNTTAVVEHDNVIADCAHISVGAKLAGWVKVGKRCFIGVGSCVRDKISIGDDCIIGAGSAVVKHITEPGVYGGVPARKLK